MTPTQRERLKQVRDSIERHGPDHFDMSYWFRGRDGAPRALSDIDWCGDEINDCGTTACLAGHARLVANGDLQFATAAKVAEWLGITSTPPLWDEARRYGSWLFHEPDWPDWARRYANRTSEWEAALVLIDELLARSPRTRFPKNGASFKRRFAPVS